MMRRLALFAGALPLLALVLLVLMLPAGTAAAQDIKVGTVIPLSGAGASYGAAIQQALQMAIGEINAAGGIAGRMIVLDVADDASDPAQSVIALQRLVNDNDDLVVGGWGSSQVLANMAVAERAGMPYIVVGASNPRITTPANKWVFRTLTNDNGHAARLVQVVNLQHYKKIAVIYDTNDYGVGLRDIFTAGLAQQGMKPIDVESYQTSDKDFTAQLTHIAAAEPDALMVFGTLPAAAAIMNQARDQGIEARFLGAAGVSNEAVMKLAPQASQHMIATGYFHVDLDADAKTWAERYQKQFANANQPPRPSLAAPTYEAMTLIAAPCLAKAGTDKDKFRLCVKDWHGKFFGLPPADEHFDATNQLVAPLVVQEVVGTEFKLLPGANQ
jgi:branched-chain amino acid transport system substrate-binding protein